LAKVTTPYTLFLNPDAQIEPEAVAHMVAFLEAHPSVGIVGPATLCGEGQTQRYQGTGPLPTPWSIVKRVTPLIPFQSDLAPIVPGAAPFKTEWVCGAIILMRTELAQRLQGFDPRFFLYWEEMDLCRRAATMGFETWAIGTAQAQHICGASSTVDDTQIFGCIGKYFYESRYYYMTKHHGWLAATVAEAVEFALLATRTLLDVCAGKGSARLRPRLQTPLFSQPAPLVNFEK
jgi:N-acetylglucosaminyl-diphospho-decaprenol L-rhamnosyltransferase